MSEKFQSSALDRLTGITYIDKLMQNNPISKIMSNPIFKIAEQHQEIIDAATPFHNLLDKQFNSQLHAVKFDNPLAELFTKSNPLESIPKIPQLQMESSLLSTFQNFSEIANLLNPSWEKSYGFINALNNSLSVIPKPDPIWAEVSAFQKINNNLLETIKASADLGLHQLSFPKNTAFDELINSANLSLDELKQQTESDTDEYILENIEGLIENLRKVNTVDFENKIVAKVLNGVKLLLDQKAKNDSISAFRFFFLSIVFSILLTVIQANWDSIISSFYTTEHSEKGQPKVEKRKLLLLSASSYLRMKPDSCDDSNRLALMEKGTFLIKVSEVPYWNYVVDVTTHQSGWISKRSMIELNQ